MQSRHPVSQRIAQEPSHDVSHLQASQALAMYKASSKKFSEMLRHFLDKTQINQAKLAQDMHVSRATINHWCRANRLPESNSVYIICKRLSLSVAESKRLVNSWAISHATRGFVPLLEEAMKLGDYDIVCTYKQLYFENSRFALWQAELVVTADVFR